MRLFAQDPVAAVLQTLDWPSEAKIGEGPAWALFSKQYYGISNWNASGVALNLNSTGGQSSVIVYRDGVPGYSWWHLYLSHAKQLGQVGVMLQLRASLIDLRDNPPVFRIGGIFQARWSLSPTLHGQLYLYDFTSWILPSASIVGGDPSIRLQLFHEPGRSIGLVTGLLLGRAHAGPVMGGIRVKMNDQVWFTGVMEVLPFGISLGILWNFGGFKIDGWLEQHNGTGITPIFRISDD